MNHFVQYHNPDAMSGPYKSTEPFYIVTDKFFREVRGSTVWLVTGEGRPRQYSLCLMFTVDTIEDKNAGSFRFRVSGAIGRKFTPFIKIDELPWFPELRKATRNFSCFQHIHSQAVIRGLQKVCKVAQT